MTQAVVAFAINELGKLLVEEAVVIPGQDEQVRSTERELCRMQCFLKDADAKRKGDERVKNWAREVQEAAYEVEDMIATFVGQDKGGFAGFMQRYVCFVNHLIHQHRVSREIENTRSKIYEISASRWTCGIDNLGGGVNMEGNSSLSLRERRRSTPLVEEVDVVGIEEI